MQNKIKHLKQGIRVYVKCVVTEADAMGGQKRKKSGSDSGRRWRGPTRCGLSRVVARPCAPTRAASGPCCRGRPAAVEPEFPPAVPEPRWEFFRAELAGGDRTRLPSLPQSPLQRVPVLGRRDTCRLCFNTQIQRVYSIPFF